MSSNTFTRVANRQIRNMVEMKSAGRLVTAAGYFNHWLHILTDYTETDIEQHKMTPVLRKTCRIMQDHSLF